MEAVPGLGPGLADRRVDGGLGVEQHAGDLTPGLPGVTGLMHDVAVDLVAVGRGQDRLVVAGAEDAPVALGVDDEGPLRPGQDDVGVQSREEDRGVLDAAAHPGSTGAQVGVVAAEVDQDEALVQGAQLLGVEEVGEADCAVGAAEQPLVQDESAHAHEQPVGAVTAVEAQAVPVQLAQVPDAHHLDVAHDEQCGLQTLPAGRRDVAVQDQAQGGGLEEPVHEGVLGALVVSAAHQAPAARPQTHRGGRVDASPHHRQVLVEGLIVPLETASALVVQPTGQDRGEHVVDMLEVLGRQAPMLAGLQGLEGVGEHVVDVLEQDGAGTTLVRSAGSPVTRPAGQGGCHTRTLSSS